MLSFLDANLGKVVCAPGGLCGECVDLANLYLIDVWGLEPVRANAADWRQVTVPGFLWVSNLPTNVPPEGSLVVWHPYPPFGIGRFGHIALVLEADLRRLLTVDANWGHQAVSIQLHSYAGVDGWHQPNAPLAKG